MKKNYQQAPPNHPCVDRVYPERGVSNQGIDSELYRTGATSRQRRRHVKEKEKRIQALFDRFNAGNISLKDNLGAIKHT